MLVVCCVLSLISSKVKLAAEEVVDGDEGGASRRIGLATWAAPAAEEGPFFEWLLEPAARDEPTGAVVFVVVFFFLLEPEPRR